ncbi:uncharacterized protein LOC114471144 [Gouania willdenowi]|uniref:uncharacterized protein LOC114471144 n=1 Tax=Gouania willdenowi TaxID=441366 RepID=UPI0010543E6F|nr:uncharacterized protein LOC114471144 [Gouania willdenowi]
MSQSQNPTDTQALLQSMLQKLKLQQGRENQPVFNPYASSSEEQQHEERRASPPLNKVEISPVSHPTRNDSPFNFSLSAVSNSVGFQDRDKNGGIASFPSQKHLSEERETSWPGITPTGVKQLFPAQTHKDADITSCETTDAKRTISSSDALPNNQYSISNKGPSLDQDQQFTPRVYMWSQKSSDSHKEEQGGKVLQFDAVDAPKSSNNDSNFRKEKSSERKPRRWTSKIKERWRYRQGSFGKKGKEESDPAEQKNVQITDVSLENPFNTLHEDGEETLTPTEIPPAQEEDSTVNIPTRSTSDFEFGLGSFSLLEEITMGQKWAEFINPNLRTTTTQSEESQSRTNTPDSTWSFSGAESSSQATAQQSPDASLPVSMDVSEGKWLQLSYQRQADQSEPMDDGVNQSSLRPAENGLDQQSRSLTSVKATSMDRLYGSVQRSRLLLNRKRHHQSQTQQMSDGEETDESVTSRQAMDESEPQQTNSHPAPESASSSSSYSPSAAPAPALRGVLKHSDRGSQSKRRRLEVNRHVHFSMEVVTIESPVLDYSDSEEEEEEEEEGEEDVVTEEAEVEQGPIEDAAPARRHALPHWILALKRKNTGKKHG